MVRPQRHGRWVGSLVLGLVLMGLAAAPASAHGVRFFVNLGLPFFGYGYASPAPYAHSYPAYSYPAYSYPAYSYSSYGYYAPPPYSSYVVRRPWGYGHRWGHRGRAWGGAYRRY